MKSYSQLENELADALAEIRWMKEAMTPPKDFRVPGLPYYRGGITKYQHIILYALATADGPLSHEKLTRRIDIVSGRTNECHEKTVFVTICRLRRALKKECPSVVIRTDWGVGYYMDDESKALVLGAERKIAA